jgi:hypothetical protein
MNGTDSTPAASSTPHASEPPPSRTPPRITSWFAHRYTRRVSLLLALGVLGWYLFVSEDSLFTKLFAASVVPTPVDARGTALDDDGKPFVLAVNEDSLAAANADALAAEKLNATKVPPVPETLTLTAISPKPVWVKIVAYDGGGINGIKDGKRRTYQYILRAKRRYAWSARHSFVVSMGFAGAVDFRLNGELIKTLNSRHAATNNVRVGWNNERGGIAVFMPQSARRLAPLPADTHF